MESWKNSLIRPSEEKGKEFLSRLMESEPFSLARMMKIARKVGDASLTEFYLPMCQPVSKVGPTWMWMFKLNSNAKIQAHPEDIFADILAHDDVKLALQNFLASNGNVNLLLLGPSSTGKSMFIRDIHEKFPSIYVEGGGSTALGIRELVRKKIQETGTTRLILLIDEIDKLVSKSKDATNKFLDQDSLANMIDTDAHLEKAKFDMNDTGKMSYDLKLTDFKVIATANYLYNISPILRARFGAPIQFRQYTKDEAFHVGKRLLMVRYHFLDKLATDTALFVTEDLHEINMREFDKLGKLIHSESELESYKRMVT
jgi:hypothetical protein